MADDEELEESASGRSQMGRRFALSMEFTPEMLEAPCTGRAARAMAKVRRNMMGMFAQKVVDVRRELFIERSGYDIYAPENLVSRGKM